MAEEIIRCLFALHELLEEDGDSCTAVSLVDSLENAALSAHDAGGRTVVCELLLLSHSPPDLLAFVHRASDINYAKDTHLVKARQRALQVVARYVRLAGRVAVTRSHGVKIFEVCFLVARRDRSATVRAEALRSIAGLLDASVLGPESIDFEQTFKTLQNDIFYASSKSPTLKGEVLRVLGKLVECFPVEMVTKASDLLNMTCASLKEQFNAKKPQLQLIAGGIWCLVHLLTHFAEHLQAPGFADKRKNLYHNIFVFGVDIPRDMKRYDVPEAALLFVARHAAIFAADIEADREDLYDRLVKCCRHTAARVRNVAPQALGGALRVVVQGLLPQEEEAAAETAAKKKAFNGFLRQFRDLLTASSVVARGGAREDLSVAVAGFGAFAPAMRQYMKNGAEDVERMLGLLIRLCDPDAADPDGFTSRRTVVATAVGMPSGGDAATTVVETKEEEDHYVGGPQDDDAGGAGGAGGGARGSAAAGPMATAAASDPTSAEAAPPAVWNPSTRELTEHMGAFSNMVYCLPGGVPVSASIVTALVDAAQRLVLKFAAQTATSDLRGRIVYALQRLFVALLDKGSSLPSALATLVPAVLRRSVSRAAFRRGVGFVGAGGGGEEMGTLVALYPDYADMWHRLLEPLDCTSLRTLSGSGAGGHVAATPMELWRMQHFLYDRMMAGIMEFLRGLDLEYSRVAEPGPGEVDFKARCPADFAVFLDAIGFCRLLLPTCGVRTGSSKAIRESGALGASPETAGSADLGGEAAPILRWVSVFGNEIMRQSNRYPRVSGFYRLLRIIMGVCARHAYFASVAAWAGRAWNRGGVGGRGEGGEEEPAGGDYIENAGAADTSRTRSHSPGCASVAASGSGRAGATGPLSLGPGELRTRLHFLLLTTQFVGEVIQRLTQYKDELLASCIDLVLSVPDEIVDPPRHVPALRSALVLGRSHLPSAEVAVEALDRWLWRLRPQVVPYLPDLLPLLGDYLAQGGTGGWNVGGKVGAAAGVGLGGGAGGAAGDDAAAAMDAAKRKSAAQVARARKPVAGSRVSAALALSKGQGHDRSSGGGGNAGERLFANQADSGDEVPRWARLRQRILMVLGSMGGLNHDMIPPVEAAIKTSLTWDVEERVVVALPLGTVKLDVALDPLLPRIVDLAETSSVRQIKSLAAELLHAIILYTLGRTATRRKDGEAQSKGEKTSMFLVYRRIFPVVLRLAVDVEPVTRRLFEPLGRQLVRWFTKSGGVGGKTTPEAMALLQAVVEGASSSEKAALRDYSGHCLAVFMEWSIKQVTKKEMQRDGSITVEGLLRRMYNMALHPSAYQRLGAAAALNHMYRSLREETALVSRHILELFHHMIVSLRLSRRDPEAMGTTEATELAIQRLQRIVVESADPMLMERSGRRTSLHADLPHFVEWLFHQTVTCETRCRRRCMAIFERLAAVVFKLLAKAGREKAASSVGEGPRKGPAAAWVGAYVEKHGLQYLVHMIEGPIAAAPAPDLERLRRRHGAAGGRCGAGPAGEPRAVAAAAENHVLAAETYGELLGWFKGLGNALDCYAWLISQNYVSVSDLLSPVDKNAGASSSSSSSSSGGRKRDRVKREGDEGGEGGEGGGGCKVISLCKTFLSRFALLDANGHDTTIAAGSCSAADGGDGGEEEEEEEKGGSPPASLWSGTSPEQVEGLCQAKAVLVRRLFKFLVLILEGEAGESFLREQMRPGEGVVGRPLFACLFRSILEPRRVGLGLDADNMSSPGNAQRIVESQHLCTALATKIGSSSEGDGPSGAGAHAMLEALSAVLATPHLDLRVIALHGDVADINATRSLLRGYRILHRGGVLEGGLNSGDRPGSMPVVVARLAALVVGSRPDASPLALQLAQSALVFLCLLGWPLESALDAVLDARPVALAGAMSVVVRDRDDHIGGARDDDDSDDDMGRGVSSGDVSGSVRHRGESSTGLSMARGAAMFNNFRAEILDMILAPQHWTAAMGRLVDAVMGTSSGANRVADMAWNVLGAVVARRHFAVSTATTIMYPSSASSALAATAPARRRRQFRGGIFAPIAPAAYAQAWLRHLPKLCAWAGLTGGLSGASIAGNVAAPAAARGLWQDRILGCLLQLLEGHHGSILRDETTRGVLRMAVAGVLSGKNVTPAASSGGGSGGGGGAVGRKVIALRLLPFFLPGTVSDAFVATTAMPGHASGGSGAVLVPVAEETELIVAVEAMMQNHFPVTSRDLPSTSHDFADYRRLLGGLLDVLARTGNLSLLRTLMIVLDEPRHCLTGLITDGLSCMAARVAGRPGASAASSRPLAPGAVEVVCNECIAVLAAPRASPSGQQWLLTRLAVPVLQSAPPALLVRLATASGAWGGAPGAIRPLVVFLVSLLAPAEALKRPMAASCALQLIQLLYERLDYDRDIKQGPVNESFAGKTIAQGAKGSELTGNVCKAARKILVSPAVTPVAAGPGSGSGLAEVDTTSLLLRRSAFNCLALVICRTQEKVKLYNNYLFKEQLAKGDSQELIWGHIVGGGGTLPTFALETDFKEADWGALASSSIGTQQRRKFVGGATGDAAVGGSGATARKFRGVPFAGIASLAVSDEFYAQVDGAAEADRDALRDGASEDLGAAAEKSAEQKEESKGDGAGAGSGGGISGGLASRVLAAAETGSLGSTRGGGMFELDRFNRNSCMVTVLRVIDFMSDKFGTAAVAAVAPPPAGAANMPIWMSMLQKSLDCPTCDLAGRLFICKILINRPALFLPFATDFFSPCLATLLQGEAGAAAGRGFHYFLRDMCQLLLLWRVRPLSGTDIDLAGHFLEHLFQVVPHPSDRILKGNVQVVASLVRLWCCPLQPSAAGGNGMGSGSGRRDAPCVRIPTAPLVDLISTRGVQSCAEWCQGFFAVAGDDVGGPIWGGVDVGKRITSLNVAGLQLVSVLALEAGGVFLSPWQGTGSGDDDPGGGGGAGVLIAQHVAEVVGLGGKAKALFELGAETCGALLAAQRRLRGASMSMVTAEGAGASGVVRTPRWEHHLREGAGDHIDDMYRVNNTLGFVSSLSKIALHDTSMLTAPRLKKVAEVLRSQCVGRTTEQHVTTEVAVDMLIRAVVASAEDVPAGRDADGDGGGQLGPGEMFDCTRQAFFTLLASPQVSLQLQTLRLLRAFAAASVVIQSKAGSSSSSSPSSSSTTIAALEPPLTVDRLFMVVAGSDPLRRGQVDDPRSVLALIPGHSNVLCRVEMYHLLICMYRMCGEPEDGDGDHRSATADSRRDGRDHTRVVAPEGDIGHRQKDRDLILRTCRRRVHLALQRGLGDPAASVRGMLVDYFDGRTGAQHQQHQQRSGSSSASPSTATAQPRVGHDDDDDQTAGGRAGGTISVAVSQDDGNGPTARLSLSPQERLRQLTSRTLFDPVAIGGCQWLRAASELLLRLARRSADYERFLPGCDEPLDACTFAALSFDDSAAGGGGGSALGSRVPMAPMFSQQIVVSQPNGLGGGPGGMVSSSVSSQALAMSTQSVDAVSQLDGSGLVRATQDAGSRLFAATQAGDLGAVLQAPHFRAASGGRAGFGQTQAAFGGDGGSPSGGQDFSTQAVLWAGGGGLGSATMLSPQGSMSQFGAVTSSLTATQDVGSPLLMLPPPPRPPRSAAGGDGGSPVAAASIAGSTGSPSSRAHAVITARSARFRKHAYFTGREGRASAAQQRQRASRMRRVVLYRRYRHGELPDVQIRTRDLVEPLSALAALDTHIAKSMMVPLFAHIYGALSGYSGGGGRMSSEPIVTGLSGSAADHETTRAALAASVPSLLGGKDSGRCDDGAPGAGVVMTAAESKRDRHDDGDDGDDGDGGSSATTIAAVLGQADGPFVEFLHMAWLETLNCRFPIPVDPMVVGTSAERSTSFHSGIRLLEEDLLRRAASARDQPMEGGSSGRSSPDDQEDTSWEWLGRLYQSLEEEDIVFGLVDRTARNPLTRVALEAELVGDDERAKEAYRKGQDLMDELDMAGEEGRRSSSCGGGGGGGDGGKAVAHPEDDLRARPSPTELRKWEDGVNECMARLGEWPELLEQILVDVDGEPRNLWKVVTLRDTHVRHFTRASLRLGAEPQQSLLAFVEDAAQGRAQGDAERMEHYEWLQDRLPLDMALLHLVTDTPGQCRKVLDGHARRFCAKWPNFHKLSTQAARRELRGLQRAAELRDCLNCLDAMAVSTSSSSSPLTTFSSYGSGATTSGSVPSIVHDVLWRWRRTWPRESLDSVEVWDDLVRQRDLSLNVLLRHRLPMDQEWGGQGQSGAGQAAGGSVPAAQGGERGSGSGSSGGGGGRAAQRQGCANEIAAHYQRGARGVSGRGGFRLAQTYLKSANAILKSVGLQAGLDQAIATASFFLAEADHAATGPAKRRKNLAFALRVVDKKLGEVGGAMAPAIEGQAAASPADSLVLDPPDPPDLHRALRSARLAAIEVDVLIRMLADAQLSMGEARSGGSDGSGVDVDALRARIEAVFGRNANVWQGQLSVMSLAARTGLVGGVAGGVGGSDGGGGSKHSGAKGTLASLASPCLAAAGRAFLQHATYCDQRIVERDRRAESSLRGGTSVKMAPAEEQDKDDRMLHAMVVGYVKALQSGLEAGRDKLPRVLGVLGDSRMSSAGRAEFAGLAQSLPSWMMLAWTAQMLPMLDGPQADLVAPLLVRMATDFPGALIYPFKISRTFLEGRAGCRAHVERLSALLANADVDAFVDALHYTHNACLRWNDGVDEVLKATRAPVSAGAKRKTAAKGKASSGPELDKARRLLRALLEDCIMVGKPRLGTKVGEHNRRFATEALAAVSKALGGGSSKRRGSSSSVSSMTLDDLAAKLSAGNRKDLYLTKQSLGDPGNAINKDFFRAGKHATRRFSDWLADYDGMAGGVSEAAGGGGQAGLEVPGQYDVMAFAPPRPELHARVASVGQELLVLGSKQRPKRLTLNGNDEREHLFLVKGGEDLRLDERVEQLYGVMNKALRDDAACAQRGLAVPTYRVIPMTPSIGIIEWVRDTAPLKEMIETQLYRTMLRDYHHDAGRAAASGDRGGGTGRKGRGRGGGRGVPMRPDLIQARGHAGARVRDEWFSKRWKTDGHFDVKAYVKVYLSVPRVAGAGRGGRGGALQIGSTTECHAACTAEVPGDALRRQLLGIARGPEAFLALRSKFARSLAATSICSYILGIGDRHLENFLVDQTTGGVIPIDFGMAFGQGAALPVPELIPFRLTNQFLRLLEPLDSRGLLRRDMVRVLTALRSARNQQQILACMDVFINEPLLDWCQGGAKGVRGQGGAAAAAAAREGARAASATSTGLGGSPVTVAEESISPELLQVGEFNARRKLDRVRWKLRGANPVDVLEDELRTDGHQLYTKNKPVMAKLLAVARGSPDCNVRARVPKGSPCESVGQQVDCLIDLATDPDVLARQWAGLATWV